MKVLVTEDNLVHTLNKLGESERLSLDTETYGLGWDDRLFSLIISDGKFAYYFNLNQNGPHCFDYDVFKNSSLLSLFRNKNITWYIHNAKYDMRRLAIEGVSIDGNIWCTNQMERFVRNDEFQYGLDACLKRRGKHKNDAVEEYIKEHKLYTQEVVPGKKAKVKKKHFDRVPFDIMFEYGCDDAILTHFLGEDQLSFMRTDPSLSALVANDMRLTKTVFAMETVGIKLDRAYVREAYRNQEKEVQSCVEQIEIMANQKYKSGPKWLKEVCDSQGIDYGLTENGNANFDKKALAKSQSQLLMKILELREAEKKITSFYSSFLYHADSDGFLHPNYKIAGTDTGRFSCADPNLQNVPKDKKAKAEDFPMRKCFIPRNGKVFVMLDYDQMEYRLMADYAGELDMIESILKGTDPHEYVAKLLNKSRDRAKTLNFGLLYGMGPAKLSASLGVSYEDAIKFIDEYFEKLPRVRSLFDRIKDTAKLRGYIFNKFGRRLYIRELSHVYKLVNHLIQGTGADVVRHAMSEIDDLLKGTNSNMLLQVHDELIFEFDLDDLHLVPKIKEIMEDAYKPFNGMRLTVGCEWSAVSWAQCDKIEGIPTKEIVNEFISREQNLQHEYGKDGLRTTVQTY